MSEIQLSHRDQVHALFVQHSAELRGFILSLLPDMGRADDVLQETFLTVSMKSDDYVEGTSFGAWVRSIARFKVLENCKRLGHGTQVLSPEVLDAVCAAYPEPQEGQLAARLDALSNCLTALAPHTRRAVELRYAYAHKAPEIAQLLGWSTDSVYVVLSRARSVLLKCIRARLEVQS